MGDVEAALHVLTADGTSTSEAIRRALVDAVRLRRREQMYREALESMSDPDDARAAHEALTDLDDIRAC